MNTDAVENQPTALNPSELKDLRRGDAVRVVDLAGRAAQGRITGINEIYFGEPRRVLVDGVTWETAWSSFYRIAEDSLMFLAPPMVVSTDGVRDAIAKLTSKPSGRNRPAALSTVDIVRQLLGYEPSAHKPSAALGGRSKDSWTNEHLNLRSVRCGIEELVRENLIRPVRASTHGKPSDDDRIVSFPLRQKTGWVLTSEYEARAAEVVSAAKRQAIADLRATAEHTILNRYADEVEAELAALISQVAE